MTDQGQIHFVVGGKVVAKSQAYLGDMGVLLEYEVMVLSKVLLVKLGLNPRS